MVSPFEEFFANFLGPQAQFSQRRPIQSPFFDMFGDLFDNSAAIAKAKVEKTKARAAGAATSTPAQPTNQPPASASSSPVAQATPSFSSTVGAGVGAATSQVLGGIGQYTPQIVKYAQQYGVDPRAIYALMATENNGTNVNPTAVSPAGAKGPMQVMPFHFQPGEDPFDPDTNIRHGVEIYANQLKKYGGDLAHAAAGYFGAGDDPNASDGYATGNDYTSKFQRFYDQFGASTPQPAASSQAPYAPPMPANNVPQEMAYQQFGNPEIDYETAKSMCGPIAAAALAKAYGNEIPLAKVIEIGRKYGMTTNPTWEQGQAMAKELLPNAQVGPADWDELARRLQSGETKGAVVSTPLHYLFANAYDPEKGFFFGNTAANGMLGGSPWMRPEQLSRLGTPNGFIYGGQ